MNTEPQRERRFETHHAAAWIGLAVGQIGVIVTDVEEAARRYVAERSMALLRLSPRPPERAGQSRPSVPFLVRVALNPQQPQIELLQPIAGPSVYDDWDGMPR
jgi:hypothetical protein